MWAVIAQNEQMVNEMIKNKNFLIVKSHRDNYHYTALHLAALTGNKNICRILIDYGFDFMASLIATKF